MAIYKKLTDYTLRGGTGGYHVEGYDPRLTVGQVNEMHYSPRGGYSIASGRAGQEFTPNLVPGSKGFSKEEQDRMMDLIKRSLGYYTQKRHGGQVEERFAGPREKEIATKNALRVAEATSEANALKADVDALASLRKNAPKDKLGNSIETDEMRVLSARIMQRMAGNVGTRRPQGPLTQENSGMDQEQIDAFARMRGEGQAGATFKKPEQSGPRPFARATPGGRIRHLASGNEATTTGITRYRDGETQFQVRLDNGKVLWVNQKDVENIEPPAQQKGPSLEDYFRRKEALPIDFYG